MRLDLSYGVPSSILLLIILVSCSQGDERESESREPAMTTPVMDAVDETSRESSSLSKVRDGVDKLKNVQTWFYYLNADLDAVLDDIVASDYDMVVIEPVVTERENRDYDIKKAVQRMKESQGRNLNNKLVVAYIDVGQAESYRYYWKSDWRIGNPDFIAGDDPDLWEGNFPVAFWRKEWQDIWFTGVGSERAQLETIIDAGFDGVYLDWIEAYSDENVVRKARQDKRDARREMIAFVERIKSYGTERDPDFIVIAQNAAELAGSDDYVSFIDAIAQEQIWFDGSAVGEPEGDCPLPARDADIDSAEYVVSLPPGCKRTYDELPESTLHVSSEEYIDHLTVAQRRGLPIFTVDYALDEENILMVYEKARQLGFIPFVSNRALDRFVEAR